MRYSLILFTIALASLYTAISNYKKIKLIQQKLFSKSINSKNWLDCQEYEEDMTQNVGQSLTDLIVKLKDKGEAGKAKLSSLFLSGMLIELLQS